jgi:Tfp pilus assembly protein PilX
MTQGKKEKGSQGFTLIAALLILVMLSGAAAGLLFMVTNEARMGGNDLESNLAFYGAESGMEKLTADLSSLYSQYQVPTNAQIQAVATFPPTAAMVPNMNYTETITYPTNGTGEPVSSWNTVSSGSNQGLYAELIPMTLQVIASRPAGASINITRNIEVALIPVFQFGVFCGYDCSYFAGPNFAFGGRVHTNQNLFLASGDNLVFDDKVSAYQQIVMDQLENGHSTTVGYGGTVYIPKANAGCALSPIPPSGEANCIALPGAATVPGDASWSGGYPTVGGSANINFPSLSTGTLNGYLTNSLTGAKNMQLPFVQNSCTSNPPPCTDPISIIRKPQAGESASSTLGTSRLYNKAQIRILIADTLADLHPERGTASLDSSDYEFPTAAATQYALTSGANEYFGWATPGAGVNPANGWLNPYIDTGIENWTAGGFPLIGELTTNPTTLAQMSSATGGPWIRVEYYNGAAWVGVTAEWLGLGFGRLFDVNNPGIATSPPTCPGTPYNAACSNTVDSNAILILQKLRPTLGAATAHSAGTSGDWWPLNFYDAREGEMRDNTVANTTLTPAAGKPGNPDTFTYSSCSVQGIMNAVELDVGNLALWLNGTIPGHGTSVNYAANNGYVLYFSDHRGMETDPNPSNGGQTPAGVKSGESGLEDVVNSSAILTSTTPDGALETKSYYTYSPEDVDQNGFLDNWGEKNLGYGFGINTNTAPLNGYKRVGVTSGATYTAYADCAGLNTTTNTILTGAGDQEGAANPVSGARHVLKLVDGGMSAGLVSYLPVMPATSGCSQSAANPTGCGGFTIVSENPVYIQGNYNTNGSDPFWSTATAATPTQTPHSAASIIADSVMVLSNSWNDFNSLLYPDVSGSRTMSAQAYYRTAISGGKSVPFPQPTWTNVANDFGTDGGMHNFLRYLESWGQTLNYDGSLVSMYYSEYNTGTYKDGPGGDVYAPPPRNYYFDVLFLTPSNLPPATPQFQDIDNLSYHQNFTPQ